MSLKAPGSCNQPGVHPGALRRPGTCLEKHRWCSDCFPPLFVLLLDLFRGEHADWDVHVLEREKYKKKKQKKKALIHSVARRHKAERKTKLTAIFQFVGVCTLLVWDTQHFHLADGACRRHLDLVGNKSDGSVRETDTCVRRNSRPKEFLCVVVKERPPTASCRVCRVWSFPAALEGGSHSLRRREVQQIYDTFKSIHPPVLCNDRENIYCGAKRGRRVLQEMHIWRHGRTKVVI